MTLASTPTILALDTAADVCSVALARGAEIVESAEVVGHRHSERILPMVQALLAGRGVQLAECDAIAFGAGPGAFTGLRIACGIAQGLAYGAGKRVIAVGNLEALALSALGLQPQATRIVVANDARMQEVYWALYDVTAGRLTERTAPAIAAVGQLAALFDAWSPAAVAGDVLSAFPATVQCVEPARRIGQARASAATIAVIAVERWRAGATAAPAHAAPLYVRDRVALTIEERTARAAAAA